MHKQIAIIVILLALALSMSGCGSGNGTPGSGNINGTWTFALTNTDGSPAYTFSTTFTQGSGGTLNITNFTFTSTGPCFASYQTSETGTFGLMGNFNGNVTGTFDMTISTMFPGATNNVLTLQGVVNGNTISGNWTLTGGTGCSGKGMFTIQSKG
jgi:hypothetical protein